MASGIMSSISQEVDMADDQAEKVRENRLRRMAERQGYRLVKSRRRDPRAWDYDRWMIVGIDTNAVVAGAEPGRPSWTIDEVEEWLLAGGWSGKPGRSSTSETRR
jgi:hypothetical protein